MIFLDTPSSTCLVRKMRPKKNFLLYKIEVDHHLNTKIKRSRTDRGGEYDGITLNFVFELNGIIHEITASRAPEQNGIAKRKKKLLNI